MASEFEPNQDVSTIWQNQKSEGVHMSVAEIRLRAGKYNHKVLWRNAREYIAALAVTVFFSLNFLHTDDMLTRFGFGLIVAGMIYVCWNLHSKGSARGLPQDLGAATCLLFHRRELERQRDLLRGVWRWYLGPMIPGLAVIIVAAALSGAVRVNHFGWMIAVYSVVVVLVFGFIARLNTRAALRLQQRIDELNALHGDAE